MNNNLLPWIPPGAAIPGPSLLARIESNRGGRRGNEGLNPDVEDMEYVSADDLSWSRAPSPAPAAPKRHSSYYIEEGNVVFLVENRLFRVHRYFLTRESGFFHDMFSLPQGHGTVEGSSDDHPLPLGQTMNITLKEMEAFLNYIYHGMHDDRTPSLDEWIALLSIASRVDCTRIRRRALREIDGSPMEPVARIQLASQHDISHWLAPAYEALVQRDEPLSPNEAERLTARTTALLAKARELVRSRSGYRGMGGMGGRGSPPPRFHPTLGWLPPSRGAHSELFDPGDVARVVKEVFEL